MAYDYTDTTDYTSPDEVIAQTAARIKALRAMQAPDMPQQGTGFRSAVTGAEFIGAQPRANILGQLTPLIAQTRAGYDESQMNADKKALSQTQIDNMVKWMKATPQGKAAIPAGPDTQEPLGPDQPTGSFIGDPTAAINQMTDPVERQRAMQAWQNQQKGNMRTVPGTPAVPATGPDEADMMAHAAAGMSNPLTKALAAQYAAYGMIQHPEKMEERGYQSGEKALDRSAALTAAQAKAIADAKEHALTRQTTLEAARIRAAGGSAADGTYIVVPGVTSANGNPVERNNKTGVTREVLQPNGDNFTPKDTRKPLPAAMAKAWTGNNVSIKQVDAVLAALETPEGSDATGFAKGALGAIPGVGEAALNYLNPDGTATRAMVQNIGSLKLHDRSGATVTAGEFPRLSQFIPSTKDAPETVKTKLRLFRREYSLMQQEILDHAEAMGYKSSGEMPPDAVDYPKPEAPAPAPPGRRRTPALPNAVAATAPAAPAEPAPTSTPDADVKVNGTSSLDINRQAYNTARNRYNSQPTPANKQARDLAYADLLRAQSDAGSDEGASIPAAVKRANAEMGGSTSTQRAAAPKPKATGGWKVERVD